MTYILHGFNEQVEIDEAESQFGVPKVVVSRDGVDTQAAIKLLVKKCLVAEYGNRLDYSRITPEIMESMSECQTHYYRMIDQTSFDREFNFRVNSFYKHVAAWSTLLDGVAFVIFSIVPHAGYDWVLYNLARLRGIPCFMFYLMPVRPGLPTMKYCLTECMNHAGSALPHSFDGLEGSHAREYFEGFKGGMNAKYSSFTRKKPTVFRLAEKIRNADKSDPALLIRKGLSRSAYTIHRALFPDPYNSTAYRTPAGDAEYPLHRYGRILYYPLHYQPEASTSPLGGPFVEQDLLVKMVASCMGDDTCLIVKDHPRRSFKSRYRQFFEDIREMPGVYLVPQDDKGIDYIAKADALIGITGTSCWEALFLGKPVLMAGTRVFENAPNIRRINGPDTITSALRSINRFKLKNEERDQYLEKLARFLFPGFISSKDEPYSTVSLKESTTFSMAVVKANLEKM